MKSSEILIIGGALLLLYAYKQSQKSGQGVAPALPTTNAQSMAIMPTPGGVNGGALGFLGGGGSGGGSNYAPVLQPSGGGFYDPFNTDFFNQTGWWAKQSYRDEFPVGPGVIDVSGMQLEN